MYSSHLATRTWSPSGQGSPCARSIKYPRVSWEVKVKGVRPFADHLALVFQTWLISFIRTVYGWWLILQGGGNKVTIGSGQWLVHCLELTTRSQDGWHGWHRHTASFFYTRSLDPSDLPSVTIQHSNLHPT